MQYRIRTGMNYPGRGGLERRAEPGDIVDDLPAASLGWLLRDGHIAEAPPPSRTPRTAAPAPEGDA